MLVTLERVVSAWLPHRGRIVRNKKSAVVFLVVICGLILAINAHMLYGMVFKIEYDSNKNPYLIKCTVINDAYYRFFNKVWPWIDLCVFCVVPFTGIVIGNAMILFKVLQSRKKTKSSIAPMDSSPKPQTQHQSNHNGRQSSMTAMLFTLNIVFLVSTSPVSIYNIGYAYWGTDISDENIAKLDFWWAVVNMFMYTNNSFNFLLYCLSGSKFRTEVNRLFSRSTRSRINDQTLDQIYYTRKRLETHSTSPLASCSKSLNVQFEPLQNQNNKINANKLGNDRNHLHPNMVFHIVKNDFSTRANPLDDNIDI